MSHIARQRQIHRLRHVIAELTKLIPETDRASEAVRALAAYGCLTRMHVVRLLAPPLEGEDHSKDMDFSPAGIRARWDAGYSDTSRVLAQAPWTGDFDPLEGFVLHEAAGGVMTQDTPNAAGAAGSGERDRGDGIQAAEESLFSAAAGYGALPLGPAGTAASSARGLRSSVT